MKRSAGELLGRIRECLLDRGVWRRTPQPALYPIENYVLDASLRGRSLRVLAMWGAGAKIREDEADLESIDFILQALESLSVAADTGWQLTVILADAHAVANGFPQDSVVSYLQRMASILSSRNVASRWLSAVLQSESEIRPQDLQFDTQFQEAIWSGIARGNRSRLIADAAQRSSGMLPENSAKRYVAAAIAEGLVLSKLFAGNMVISFASPHLYFLQPGLPAGFLFVNARRETLRPWFRAVENASP